MSTERLPVRIPQVTERQWQVAELVAEGRKNEDIAEELGITVAGAKYHVSELLRRLDLTSRDEIRAWYRDERMVRSDTVERSVFERKPPPAVTEALVKERGWPRDLVDLAVRLRAPVHQIEWWLSVEGTVEDAERWLRDRERLMFGTLRIRLATWFDNEALGDLFANAPTNLGDCELTVERGPYAFAQFRLQDRFHVQVIEDRGLLMAGVARSYPYLMVQGEARPFEYQVASCVRSEARGNGYSRLISHLPRPAQALPAVGSMYLLDPQDVGAHGWLLSKGRRASILAPGREDGIPGYPVTVHYVTGAPALRAGEGIRPACAKDLDRCADLINRTHCDRDFFPMRSAAALARRFEDGGYEDLRRIWPYVYGLRDFTVVERRGRVVACAGFWDRGRDVREIWRDKRSGRRSITESAALMDFGFEEGCEDAALGLIDEALVRTQALGRNRLMLSVDHLPEIKARLSQYQVSTETKVLHYSFDEPGFVPSAAIKPYADPAYW